MQELDKAKEQTQAKNKRGASRSAVAPPLAVAPAPLPPSVRPRLSSPHTLPAHSAPQPRSWP